MGRRRSFTISPVMSFRKQPSPMVPDTPALGRNEPCPCGSGLKFKKCCGDESRPPLSRWWRMWRLKRIMRKKGGRKGKQGSG